MADCSSSESAVVLAFVRRWTVPTTVMDIHLHHTSTSLYNELKRTTTSRLTCVVAASPDQGLTSHEMSRRPGRRWLSLLSTRAHACRCWKSKHAVTALPGSR